MRPEHYAQIVGRAWDSSDDEGVKLINTIVGVQHSCLWVESTIRNLQKEIKDLKIKLENPD
jgi:hypothetical protein